MKYIKSFTTSQKRIDYENSLDYIEPYVSLVTEDESIHYNKPHDYSKDYLTTEALEDGTISFNIGAGVGTDCVTSISYKLNNNEWITINNTNDKSENLQITVNVSTGDKVQWKCDAVVLADRNNDTYSFFSSTATFNVYGNIMSMLYGDNFSDKTSLEGKASSFDSLFYDKEEILTCGVVNAENLILPATTLAYGCYSEMFRNCTNLITAPELPATILAYGCYIGMFRDCTNLTTVPKLSATTLAEGCYSVMFQGCINLTTAPELPATTLVEGCYSGMFQGCTSLNTVSELPAITLAYACYAGMFSGCTSLNSITCLATNISADSCTLNWLYNVASSGTFTKATNMKNWTTGNSGIPSNWTVQDAS